MAVVDLSPAQRRELEETVRHGRDAKAVKRAQGVLWLSDGEYPQTVAGRQRVSRQSVYEWARRIRGARPEDVKERLKDRPRTGRPARKWQEVTEVLREVMDTSPTSYGYRSSHWTSPLLREHLRRARGIWAGDETIRHCLRALGYRWKRPRYILARRDPHWRQSKGG